MHGVGKDADQPAIQRLATAAGELGKAHMKSFSDLRTTFVEIAKGGTTTDAMFKKIGEKLSEHIETKLAFDYL